MNPRPPETAAYTQHLEDLAAGFQRSQVLFTALREEIFSHLQDWIAAEELGRVLQWSPRGTRMLLDALVGLELVQKLEHRYRNAPVAQQCLVPGAPQDQRHILRHKANSWERWGKLDEAARVGAPPPSLSRERTPEGLRAFICGMADIARNSAEQMIDVLQLDQPMHLLDLGAGPGSYTIALLKRHPHMRATCVDLPEVLEITAEEVTRAGIAERVTLLPGDVTRDTFPPDFDVVLLSNMIHMLGPEENQDLIRRCHAAMIPGGKLVIKDFIVEDERTGPPFSLIFALHMLLSTTGGDVYTRSQVAEWTSEAGFEGGELLDLTPQTRLWVVQR